MLKNDSLELETCNLQLVAFSCVMECAIWCMSDCLQLYTGDLQ
jgi:hypothetical protein